jgi:hypothetical protein
MKHKVSHQLDFATAKGAAESAIKAYKDRFPEFSPDAKWVTEKRAEVSFTAKGFTLKGALELVDNAIEMEVFDVPFVFKIFQKKALGIIEDEIKEWIGKAKSAGT